VANGISRTFGLIFSGLGMILMLVWPSAREAVVGYLKLLFVASTWATGRDCVRDFFVHRISISAPFWVVLGIVLGIVALFLEFCRRTDRMFKWYKRENLNLGNQLEEVTQAVRASAPDLLELPSSIQEIVIDGLRWKCTHGRSGEVDSATPFCPTCDTLLYPTRRFSINGAPARYFCGRCGMEVARFTKTGNQVLQAVSQEVERLERLEKRTFQDLVARKIADGLSADQAREVSLRQVEHDRQEAIHTLGPGMVAR